MRFLGVNFVFFCSIGLFLQSCNLGSYEDGEITYNTHIRPILSDKCFKCHGPDEKKRISGYRLDTKEGAYALLKNQRDKYGIVPGHSATSEVFLRIISKDPAYQMPPPTSNLALTDKEISLITKWIDQGAAYEPHWALQPIEKPALPKVNDKSWPNNEIDFFTLAKMESRSLTPNGPESKELLLRRVYHDIIGLPPSISEQEQFLSDQRADAYSQVVDRLLSNEHFGEKMAIIWMDLARYADSHGYQDDGLRTMWPWRDWVIYAFNQNYDYKKFVTWQLAGDLLPSPNKETILATGFNRNHKITQEGGVIDEEYRVEYVADRTNTFSKGLLAMTFECAKCHDHKYDPISQKDYYGTFAFFNQINEKGFNGDIQAGSLADPPYMTITKEDKQNILSFIRNKDTSRVNVMIMADSAKFRPTYVLERGVYDKKLAQVSPGTPSAILRFDTNQFEKNRLGLANWLFDPKNPLTARVFVNLIWQDFFGRGIVRTAGDFGLQGDLPSHPELLDWLASDFAENGWNIKRLIKKIVLSKTYQQQSHFSKASTDADPENIYLSHGPRNRLSGELLKDHILASSGIINLTVGGPSVKIYQPKGIWESATSGRGQLATYIQDHGGDLYRRGLYHFIKRTVPPPSMLIFDASNRDQCEVRRVNTNTPLQALVLMNDVQVLEAARFLAQQQFVEKTSIDAKIKTIFRKIVCRKPLDRETGILNKYYQQTLANLTEEQSKKILKVGEIEPLKVEHTTELAALMQTILLVYNLEETSIR